MCMLHFDWHSTKIPFKIEALVTRGAVVLTHSPWLDRRRSYGYDRRTIINHFDLLLTTCLCVLSQVCRMKRHLVSLRADRQSFPLHSANMKIEKVLAKGLGYYFIQRYKKK
jgi:hypothetical protein